MTVRYLSRPQIAERIGVKRDTMNKYQLPPPDARIGDLPGWLPKTIDAWQATRPGRGNWGHRKPNLIL
jgi:predicted DNA-binding transcriptional regulator AlpA